VNAQIFLHLNLHWVEGTLLGRGTRLYFDRRHGSCIPASLGGQT
jgi:hypothetical protein